jgi:hypothetical protein
VAEGADFIDVGAESTRPGSSTVPQEEELERLLPVLKELAGLSAPVSADTRKPQVMREAAAAGAAILNDVTALSFTPESLGTAAELKLPAVLMHTQGNPDKMQDNPVYKDAVIEVYDYLENRIAAIQASALARHLSIIFRFCRASAFSTDWAYRLWLAHPGRASFKSFQARRTRRKASTGASPWRSTRFLTGFRLCGCMTSTIHAKRYLFGKRFAAARMSPHRIHSI